jgi:stress-induced morphogen
MPALVKVSSVETMDKLNASIADFFKKGKYEEITESIGLHSILIAPQYTMKDQVSRYRAVLDLLKDRISKKKGKEYGAWYAQFPQLMEKLVSQKQIVTDALSQDMLSSHHEAFGAFKSVDDFFVWALDDRRLTLDQIVKYIEKTAEMP